MMQMRLNKAFVIMCLVSVACVVMAIVEIVFKPGYLMKSLIKIFFFMGSIVVYMLVSNSSELQTYFKTNTRLSFKKPLILGVGLYALIVGCYVLLQQFIDLSEISSVLLNDLNIDRANFLFVALYISFFNSLIEELFFRGFAMLTLQQYVSKKRASVFSSLTFALYHVSIIMMWFDVWLVLLAIVALVVGGLIFNALNQKERTIYNSWFVHMFANFAINTIGFVMYGFI